MQRGDDGASLANLTVVFVGRCGDCGLVGIPLARLVVLRAGRRRDGGAAGVLLVCLASLPPGNRIVSLSLVRLALAAGGWYAAFVWQRCTVPTGGGLVVCANRS